MQIKLLIEGGEMKPGPVLSQQLGPVGVPMGEVISKVNDATKEFKGMKVPVELDVNPDTKAIEVSVSSPPTSELLKKELGLEKGSGEQKKMQVANASIENIIAVTKTKMPNLLSKDLKAAVKTVVGSCVSLGVLVESKTPQEVEKEIDEGKYDTEISQEKTETPAEKKKALEAHFKEVQAEQERIRKQEEAAKAAEEAAKAEEAPAEGEEKPAEGEEGEEKKEEAKEETPEEK